MNNNAIIKSAMKTSLGGCKENVHLLDISIGIACQKKDTDFIHKIKKIAKDYDTPMYVDEFRIGIRTFSEHLINIVESSITKAMDFPLCEAEKCKSETVENN